MKLFSKCDGCKKRKLLIKKRSYTTDKMGKITSNDNYCGECAGALQNLINSQNL